MSAEFRVQEIKTRRLEIAATLAEWKRAYFVDGIGRPIEDRLTLDAEYTRLALELRTLGDAAVAAKVERRKQENADYLSCLIEVLKEHGREDLLAEATARKQEAA